MRQASALYRLLGDEARLRLLRVLSRERLNVTELTGILGLAQSGVSRHLGLLKEAGLVVEEKDAGYTYYRLAPALQEDGRHSLWPALQQQFEEGDGEPVVRADEARLQEVLRLRKENFDTHGSADTRDARQLVPGRSWAAWSRALGQLLPPLEVADLGCGEGYLTIEAARWASRVIAVDRSEAVLERAKGLARRRRVSNVVWKRGELDKLPIKDQAVDVALLSQALHHAQIPRAPSRRPSRSPKAGGRVLVLDLRVARRGMGPGQARRSPPRVPRRGAGRHADSRRASRRARRRRRAQGGRSIHGTRLPRGRNHMQQRKPDTEAPGSTACWPAGSSSSTARWGR